MYRAVAVRKVCPDRQQSNRRSQPSANLPESTKVRRVPRVVHTHPAALQHITSIAAVHITEHARSPVLRRSHRHREPRDTDLFPPLHRMHTRKSQPADQVLNPLWHHHHRRPPNQPLRSPDDPPERPYIQMIHMGMGQQHNIDRRQTLPVQPRMPLSPQHNQAPCKDRINQRPGATQFQQKRRVPDKGHGILTIRERRIPLLLPAQRLLVTLPHQPPHLLQLANNRRRRAPRLTRNGHTSPLQ